MKNDRNLFFKLLFCCNFALWILLIVQFQKKRILLGGGKNEVEWWEQIWENIKILKKTNEKEKQNDKKKTFNKTGMSCYVISFGTWP